MSNPLREFQDVLLRRRVVAGFLTKTAMEHDSPEALKEYLHEHPDADPKNHKVKKSKGGAPSGDASADSAKADTRSKDTDKLYDEMKSLKSKAESANPSAQKKFDRAYDKMYANGEAAAKSAEKLLKKFDDLPEDSEAAHAVGLLANAVRGWERNKADHARALGEFTLAHKKLQQAEQTHGHATYVDKHIKMLSKALKGEY